MINEYYRGATYNLKVKIKEKNGQVIDNRIVDTILFTFNDINKHYPQDGYYDSENQCYVLYLTQEDTLSFGKNVKQQIKIKFTNGDVVSSKILTTSLYPTLSEEVL